jgi:hypothetical protein
MADLAPDTTSAIGQLEAALASPSIPARVAKSCAQLVEKLKRPVRVGLFGLHGDDTRAMLTSFLGEDLLPGSADWPTLEISWGETARVTATLSDATTLSEDGAPGADLLAKDPVFLSVASPQSALERMSFLCLNAGDNPAEQTAALSWAARRVDISIWCTRQFEPVEEGLWATAPDGLKNHAFLVITSPDAGSVPRPAGMVAEFDGVFAIPQQSDAVSAINFSDAPGWKKLLSRLGDDIEEALSADVDAARLFLHRFGHLAVQPAPAKTEEPADAPAPRSVPESDVDMVALVSDPFLYLKRRTRVLLEELEWTDDAQDDWAANVLSHCGETAEELRERAANWPADHPRALTLQRSLDDACDMAVLLQIEGGPEQATDAANMLLQIRQDFEHELAA